MLEMKSNDKNRPQAGSPDEASHFVSISRKLTWIMENGGILPERTL
jgi:hypothetical protein